MNTFETKFGLQQEVRIVAINVIGRVTGIIVDEDGISYRVVYWNDGCRSSISLFEWELQ